MKLLPKIRSGGDSAVKRSEAAGPAGFFLDAKFGHDQLWKIGELT